MGGVHVFETTHKRGGTLGYHRHGVVYVTVVLSGSYVEVHSLAPAAYAAGSVVLHGLHEEHSDYFTDDAVCLNLEVADTSLKELGGQASHNDRDVRSAADALTAAYYRNGDIKDAAGMFQSALRNAARKPLMQRPEWLRHVLQAFDWIGAEPIHGAAVLAGVHPAYFSRAFTNCIGMTPVAYRQHERLRLASRMVLGSDRSLAAIAAESGFSDQSHLTRTFSASLGMSPARFRGAFQS